MALIEAQKELQEKCLDMNFKGSFSYGCVSSTEELNLNVEEMVNLADKRMYDMKKLMKMKGL